MAEGAEHKGDVTKSEDVDSSRTENAVPSEEKKESSEPEEKLVPSRENKGLDSEDMVTKMQLPELEEQASDLQKSEPVIEEDRTAAEVMEVREEQHLTPAVEPEPAKDEEPFESQDGGPIVAEKPQSVEFSSESMMQDGQTSSSSSSSSSSSQCYCGKERTIGKVELQCASCLKWFHAECVGYYIGKCVPFMTNYLFLCKNKTCNPNGENFNKRQASFSQMCYTAVANLTFLHGSKPEPRTMLSKDKDIIPYIDKHWESLTTMPRRIKLTWHTTITKTMMKDSDIFVCSEEIPGDPHFGLVNQDLSKIGPTYELTRGPLTGRIGDSKTGSTFGESQAPKSRGNKRKSPFDSAQQTGSKQKKSDFSSAAKMAPHGYPLEHPFNKDGYRYILAEQDPHAPNRQAFDESSDWAGKPIPGYLYRTFLSSEVLLALHDRAPQLKISEDRLTVTGDKGYSMVRATHGICSGAWFYEVTIDDMPAETATRIGWSQSLGNLQAPCGYDKFSYSWRSKKGTRFHQSRGKHYSDGYSEGDVLGFYIFLPQPDDIGKRLPHTYKDKPLVKFKSHLYYEEKDYVADTEKNLKTLPNSKLIVYKNGESQGILFKDLFEGIYHPAVSLYRNSTVSLNLGPDFKYPPKDVGLYSPMSEAANQAMIEYSLADIIYHIENEGKQPEF